MKYKDGNTWKEITIKALDSMPIGCIILFAGSTIPTGWLKCEGQSLLRTEYSELFGVIGTTYGYGSSNTETFQVPNYKGRVPVGRDSSDTDFDTLGETGGEKTHTLTINETPSHSHYTVGVGVSTPTGDVDHNHPIATYATANATDLPYSFRNSTGNAVSGKTNNIGGGQAHNIVQPFLVVNFIIKAKNTTPTMASIVDDYSTSTTDGYSANYVNGVKQDLEDAINDKQGEGTLLYTNSNPGIEFNPQTLNFNGTYKYYDIIIIQDQTVLKLQRVYVDSSGVYSILENIFNGYLRTRGVLARTSSLVFGDGTFFSTYANPSVNNYQCIPYKIIGYK